MLKNVIIIYASLKDDKEFCEFVVKDQRYFNIKILNEILKIVTSKNYLDYEIVKKYQEFLLKLESFTDEKIDLTSVIKDIPD